MNTFFGKTAQMIQAVDDSLGNLQKILLKIMTVLVVLSVSLCTIALIYLLTAKHQDFKEVRATVLCRVTCMHMPVMRHQPFPP